MQCNGGGEPTFSSMAESSVALLNHWSHAVKAFTFQQHYIRNKRWLLIGISANTLHTGFAQFSGLLILYRAYSWRGQKLDDKKGEHVQVQLFEKFKKTNNDVEENAIVYDATHLLSNPP